MKNLLLLFCFTATLLSFSQEKKEFDFKKNELKIDGIYLVAVGALNISYERILTDESGVGATLILSNGKDLNTTFSLTPYYRFYFGKKPAAGFFFEGFTSVSSFTASKYQGSFYDSNTGIYTNYPDIEKKFTDLAVGFGLGAKWITKKGVVFEINSGIGRNLLQDYEGFSGAKIVGRGGISIGYRF